MPILTVLLPAHNAENTIEITIKSLLNQTFKDFEVWILENGSTDKTLAVSKTFESSQLKVFELGPIGFQNALQWGIDNAQSEYLARMDADDICLPERFEIQMNALLKDKSLVLCGTSKYFITPFGHVFSQNENIQTSVVDQFSMSNLPKYKQRFFADPSVIFRRDIAQKVEGYDTEFNVGDVSLWIKMLKNNHGIQLEHKLLIYLINPKSMSTEINYNYQTHLCRQKHFDEYVAPTPPDLSSNHGNIDFKWLQVGLMEISSGHRNEFLKALKLSGKKITIIDKFKSLFYPIYIEYLKLFHQLSYTRQPKIEEYISTLKKPQ